jgi:hypothetical protein
VGRGACCVCVHLPLVVSKVLMLCCVAACGTVLCSLDDESEAQHSRTLQLQVRAFNIAGVWIALRDVACFANRLGPLGFCCHVSFPPVAYTTRRDNKHQMLGHRCM